MVAVLPFESLSADSTRQYFARGMTEEIAGRLSGLAALRVLAQDVLTPYREASDRTRRMVEELGVGSIVQGSVRDGGMRKGTVEMYARGRFFTITGVAL